MSADTKKHAETLAEWLDHHGKKTAHADAAAELRRLAAVERAFEEWLRKTEWVQQTSMNNELGLHRADILRSRVEAAKAERVRLACLLGNVAAVAHAGGLADLSERDALIAVRRMTVSHFDTDVSLERVRQRVADAIGGLK